MNTMLADGVCVDIPNGYLIRNNLHVFGDGVRHDVMNTLRVASLGYHFSRQDQGGVTNDLHPFERRCR